MKQNLIFFLCLAIAAPMEGGNKSLLPVRKPAAGESRWTGNISMEEIITISAEGLSAESKRKVQASFQNALPTLFRDNETTDLTFTDDKGTGSHTYHSEETLAGRKCVTDCASTSKAELHQVVVDEIANIYHIEVISPECQGTTCADDGSPTPYNSTVSVLALDERLGASKDVLSGTKTETGELPGGMGKFTRVISWHFVRAMETDVELIVIPRQYDTWLPLPGNNFMSPGSAMNISLKLRGRNGAPTNKKAKSFELRLSNTSREPGLTINFPVNSSNRSADIKFLQQADAVITDTASQSMIIHCRPERQTADFKIGAFDGGGWTILNVEAILQDDTRVLGRLLDSDGEPDIRIPKREPNSEIAEAWLKQYGNPGETDDKESSKGNSKNGDGLTVYEEYRGVISEGKFKRLDPTKKELGVDVIKPELPFFSEGIKWFEKATGLTVIIFHEDQNEIGMDRRLNKNAVTNHDFDQYALRLYRSVIPGGALGKAYGGPAIPARTFAVVIDYDAILGEYAYLNDYARNKLSTVLPFTLQDLFAKVIAHEMGHGVNCWHHGPTIGGSPGTVSKKEDPFRIYRYPSTEILDRPFLIEAIIGGKGNQESGDIACFMAYAPWCKWAISASGGITYLYQAPMVNLGRDLCISAEGTGINKKDNNGNNNYFGDASKGKCLEQIQLRN